MLVACMACVYEDNLACNVERDVKH